MIKKAFLSIASLFLVWQSYGLLILLDQLDLDAIGVLIFIAWLINLFITGIFAFAGFAWPTQKAMPESYYKVKQPRRFKRLYKLLKVEWFRKALLATLWRSKKQRAKHFDGKRSGIDNLIEQSKKSEFGHLIPFVIVCLVSVYMVVLGQYTLSILTLLINIIGNLYPILLQRHHRMRIQLIRKRGQWN
jgi:hypothetical protein